MHLEKKKEEWMEPQRENDGQRASEGTESGGEDGHSKGRFFWTVM